MHDIRTIRDDPQAFDAAMSSRGIDGAAAPLVALDEQRRAAIHAAETARAAQNAASKKVGAAKAAGDDAEFDRLRAEVTARKAELAEQEAAAARLDAELTAQLMALPNVPAADIPVGPDDSHNVVLKTWGDIPSFDFQPKEHYDLPIAQDCMDFETAAKLSGSRFVLLKGRLARLHRALAQFMLDLHVDEHGLTEINAPVLVRSEAMTGTGQLPKFAEDSYATGDHWLIPTSEVPLTNMVAGQTLGLSDLPQRYAAHSLCFRSEAGSAGRDTAGMLRQHQFEKVEMVSITAPEDSEAEHARMVRQAETVLERLGLPYRTVALSTGDMGFSATRTHDIEVWLPGQNQYREISSISNCGPFQARRMNARYRPEGGKPDFVHTLNGSGLAVGRTLIAVLENYQRANGSVELPNFLV